MTQGDALLIMSSSLLLVVLTAQYWSKIKKQLYNLSEWLCNKWYTYYIWIYRNKIEFTTQRNLYKVSDKGIFFSIISSTEIYIDIYRESGEPLYLGVFHSNYNDKINKLIVNHFKELYCPDDVNWEDFTINQKRSKNLKKIFSY